jgi:hypothetical protein
MVQFKASKHDEHVSGQGLHIVSSTKNVPVLQARHTTVELVILQLIQEESALE